MKKALNNISFVIGFVLLLAGLLLYGINRLGLADTGNPKLPVVILIFGIGLVVAGACETFIKQTKEMQIEANDERNIIIGKTAKAFAYDIMTILSSSALIILILFDFITMGAFLTLFAVYMISQIAFVVKLWYLQEKAL